MLSEVVGEDFVNNCYDDYLAAVVTNFERY